MATLFETRIDRLQSHTEGTLCPKGNVNAITKDSYRLKSLLEDTIEEEEDTIEAKIGTRAAAMHDPRRPDQVARSKGMVRVAAEGHSWGRPDFHLMSWADVATPLKSTNW